MYATNTLISLAVKPTIFHPTYTDACTAYPRGPNRYSVDRTCTRYSRPPASATKSYRSLSPQGFDTRNPILIAFITNANSANSPCRFGGSRFPFS